MIWPGLSTHLLERAAGKLLTTAPHWCGYIPWLVQLGLHEIYLKTPSMYQYMDIFMLFCSKKLVHFTTGFCKFEFSISFSIVFVVSNECPAAFRQFVVPPCWFGKPAPSTGPLGPDGKPEWCKWVSPNAIEYVPDCKGGGPRWKVF